MTFPYSQENTESRRRLETLVRGLSDQDLARSTDYGWTIAALLAHFAFWDQRVLVILRRWKEAGFDPSHIDAAAVNDSLRVICHALEPRTAIELCLSSAEAVDAELETLTPDLVKQMEEHAEATSTQFRMNRSLHRDGHLDDIESLLGQDK
ncbi:MAG TPA: maleylpyruvate isomerase N-terminal domain-containing protein [Anaerolineales bacterium]|nr:maleylpyruvate isomerase N-terminal domain-containing protein [Anaerolineales bacterium]